MAQSVERILGKDEVSSSILLSSTKVPGCGFDHVSGLFLFMLQIIRKLKKYMVIFTKICPFVL